MVDSPVIRVFASGGECYIKFGDSTICAAASGDYPLATNKEYFFSIDTNYPRGRIGCVSGSFYFSEKFLGEVMLV